MPANAKFGFVAIGRNEGERLKACLRSMPADASIVYVDSASSDGSAEFAKSLGAEVVDLDLSRPFTAARARNEGLQKLVECWPELGFVQFVDGDCELVQGWCETALARLQFDERLAAVCGQRVEKFPENSLYNAMCDAEWNTPIGEAAACGGDAMMRISALQSVGAYDPAMTAHEEPEMCSRLRFEGFRIDRIDAIMTRHDADITRFSQWWRRNVRAGYGYAQADAKYRRQIGAHLDQARNAEILTNSAAGLLRRTLQWGLVIPVIAITAAFVFWPLALAVLALYPLQILRRFVSMQPRNLFNLKRSVFEMISKFAETRGFLTFASDRIGSRQRDAISYK